MLQKKSLAVCLVLLPFIFIGIFLALFQAKRMSSRAFDQGAVIRGDVAKRGIALVFTGHEFSDGGEFIREALKKNNVKASFFFTGDFYREPANAELISHLIEDGHYLGPHSDKHLLYCSWEIREKLLVSKEEFSSDILENYKAMKAFGITKEDNPYFIPPYEWYNETIVAWAKELGLILFNFTPGTASNADYTTPSMPNYKSSVEIYKSIVDYEKSDPHGLNGFILLIHIGTHPDRKDKFYWRVDDLVEYLQKKGYVFIRVDGLLKEQQRKT
jgi:peptidoglycan/xylan/chitin deacetylase (PgdA/CDA1 family)